MAVSYAVYKCNVCGQIVEALVDGKGQVVCCGRPMTRLEAQTADYTTEKHVPVIEEVEGGIKVKVGSIPHPMTNEHWIVWIEVITEDGELYRKYLNPGDAPEVVFKLAPGKKIAFAREYCNLHGLWKTK
ncbi:MAG: desulfoferrodoxin [Thermosulfidibacteraceae bacterium]|jgi:superoxide reductase